MTHNAEKSTAKSKFPRLLGYFEFFFRSNLEVGETGVGIKKKSMILLCGEL